MWPGVIGPYSGLKPLDCALEVPGIQMPYNPITLCRDLRKAFKSEPKTPSLQSLLLCILVGLLVDLTLLVKQASEPQHLLPITHL
jgi:hypothetical protein